MDAAHSSPPSEQQMEVRLRTLLGVLNRRLNRLYLLMGAGWILAAPVAVAVVAEETTWAWWTAIVGGAGGSAAVIAVVGILIEAWLGRCSAQVFNASFPQGTPERALALKMLAELRTFRRKAESALSTAIESLSPADAVVRSKVDPVGEVQAALASLDGSPPAPTQPAAPAATESASAVRRSGGAYAYIPLEPRAAEEQGPGPAPADERAAPLPLEIANPPAHRGTDRPPPPPGQRTRS